MSGEDVDKIGGEQASKQDEQVANLSSEISRIQDARNEDRFLGTLILVIILNVHFFAIVNDWGGALAILVLELLGLIILAKRLEVDIVVVWLDKILSALGANGRNGND